jgi:hypothetical protein
MLLSKEGVSKGQRKRFQLDDALPNGLPAAEWTATAAELEPIAVAELERIAGIKALVDAGYLARRISPGLPSGAEVRSAKRGTWQVVDDDDLVRAQGNTWHCDYCNWQDLCHALGPGRVPVEHITTVELGAPEPDPEPVGAIKMGRVG